MLSGENSLLKAAEKILKMGIKYLIIKKGEHGCMFFSNHKLFIIPSYPTKKTKDPTGAGDTFAGGIAGYLTKTQDISFENLKNAMIYGANLASFCVEKFGTERMEELTADDVKLRLKAFKELTQFDIKLS